MKIHSKTRIAIYITLIFLMLIWISPLYVAIKESLKVHGFGNYIAVLTSDRFNYFRVVLNSFIVAASSAIIVVFVTTFASYAFSKMNFKGKKIIYYLILACLAIPVAAVMVPLFFTICKFGLIDNLAGIILPLIAFNAPLMLILAKNYFDGIPNEILEAARIDGCRNIQIYLKIMIPLSGPIIATIAVLTFVYSWNDFLLPLLVIRNNVNFTVTIAAQSLMETTYATPTTVAQANAALLLMTIPSIIVFLCSRKYLQAGIVAGSVKG
jgi:raffinose/stachyose/melibiose transport system permease protein